MFGNLFGGSDDKSSDGELASFANLAAKEDINVAYDSITTYLVDWSKLFEGEGGKQRGLTTPVSLSTFETSSDGEEENDDNDDDILESMGVKLIFKPPKDNYYSKSEERAKERGDGGSQEKKKEEVSPGGVQVVAQKMSSGELRVVATRCDIEEGTVIKEMSEEAIVDDLRKAIKIWREKRK